jgi:hypothetical protein
MLLLEELKKTNSDWDAFLVASGFQPYVVNTPQTKRETPSSVENIVHTESSKRRKMVKKDKSSQSTDKISEVPSQPLDEETSPMEECSPMETSSSKERNLKGKKLVFSPPVVPKLLCLKDHSPDQQQSNMSLCGRGCIQSTNSTNNQNQAS